ncbi:hypothetical protein [Nitratiruptor sp. SB155-2]|uniref:hypothetical protein n=1 Tax=Nitratiruptor sp. (strain SB155-2) TaxID=387092 RepID=UPI0001586F87|nr:hypothetical protein [Nitratiruptor sp. SB155-2]BAF69298.1 hypothetical protein NIS_0184 [Nitratiruptor sp. SB155-2]
MQLHEILSQSNIIAIEGKKKIGKLTFALFLTQEILPSSNILLISALEKSLFQKRATILKSLHLPVLDKAFSHMQTLHAKKDINLFKFKYGIDFFIEDIKRACQQSDASLIILHKTELLLEHFSKEDIKLFIEEIASFFQKENKKVLYTYDSSAKEISDSIENFSDITFFIEATENNRIVTIKNSLLPSNTRKYRFILEKETLRLLPFREKTPHIATTAATSNEIVLITSNKEIEMLHRYLFHSSSYKLFVTDSVTYLLEKILDNPALLIYNPKEETFDTNICQTIRKHHLASNLIFILNKNFVRYEDRMIAKKEGCYEILPKNFIFKEYIMAMEQALGNYFYSTLIEQLPNAKEVYEYKKFQNVLTSYQKQGIFFTLVHMKTKSPQAISAKIRNNDIFFQDNQNLYIAFLHIRKIHIDNVLKKFDNFEIVFIKEAYELDVKDIRA